MVIFRRLLLEFGMQCSMYAIIGLEANNKRAIIMKLLQALGVTTMLFFVAGSAMAKDVTLTFVNNSDETVSLKRIIDLPEQDSDFIKTNMPEKQLLAPKQSVSFNFQKGKELFRTNIVIYPETSAETGEPKVCSIDLEPDHTELMINNEDYVKLYCWNRGNIITIANST